MIYYFPRKEFSYKRTPEFIADRFGKSAIWDPQISVQARSPGEAILKFNRCVEHGQAIGAYEW